MKNNIGIIVGRFQCPNLHEGHISLIQHVIDESDKVVIFVGVSKLIPSSENPLTFPMVRESILERFSDVEIYPLLDIGNNPEWSKQLDNTIETIVESTANITLYGSRDSFIKVYSGKYKTETFSSLVNQSATQRREACSIYNPRNHKRFRDGVIWATQNSFSYVLPVIECFPYIDNKDGTKTFIWDKNDGSFPIFKLQEVNTSIEEFIFKNVVCKYNYVNIQDYNINNIKYLGTCICAEYPYNRSKKEKALKMAYGVKIDGESLVNKYKEYPDRIIFIHQVQFKLMMNKSSNRFSFMSDLTS